MDVLPGRQKQERREARILDPLGQRKLDQRSLANLIHSSHFTVPSISVPRQSSLKEKVSCLCGVIRG